MSFFESQERAQKRTTLLVFYFIIGVLLTIIAIDAIIVGAMTAARQEHYLIQYQGEWIFRKDTFYPLVQYVGLFVSPIILGIILLGSLITCLQLRGGGLAVAKMVNAKPIDPNTTDPQERRFINVVEEMSIASSVTIPALFVMDKEPSINAFVSGLKPEDTVMVVSKGALDKLSRQELQGVVGHEFSHVFHKDMRISLYLMGLTAGLLLIGKIGQFALRATYGSRRGSSGSNKGDPRFQIGLLIFGIGLLIVGAIGLFFGRLMKAAVSRQRELLADASSVAYTRNPAGLVFALRRIQQDSDHSYLSSVNAEDVSHICFCPALRSLLMGVFSTHPPLSLRIAQLDPTGELTQLPLPRISSTTSE